MCSSEDRKNNVKENILSISDDKLMSSEDGNVIHAQRSIDASKLHLLEVTDETTISVPEDDTIPESTSNKQLLQLTAGAIAGAVSRTCTAPIDRLKLMRQVYGYKHKGSGFVEAYQYMFREGGILSLWRGNGINVLKIAPETALKYGSYEHYKRLLVTGSSESQSAMARFMAGSLAGSTAQTIIYPLEVLKTRMCLRKTGQFSSIWDCARHVYHENGILAFYRGYGVNLLGIIPYAGIELALYERCKLIYSSYSMSNVAPDPGGTSSDHYEHHPPFFIIPLFAAFSSACAIIVTYPASLVRAKLQATFWSHSTQVKITAVGLLRTILTEDGITGLYRGMGTNLVKVLPAVGISLATYEALRREFHLGPLGSG